ncbi:family 43 glycosylhydrolase [uncultured Friedmanniella sp.]|uniref:glycoside hydrolase family 43 protein n=1 Tax=uncultured Friedmanniella sp. TaxID=335381 RepID=UPI0035CBAA35
MRARALLAALALLPLAACSPAGQSAAGGSSPTSPAGSGAAEATFANPVLGRGADPFLTVVDGRYYYVQSTSDGKGVSLRSSTSLATLGDATRKRVFSGGKDGAPCCEWWAPELHKIGSRWYIYVAADDGDNNHHRSYVLESDTVDGPYRFAGRLELPGDRWAIDATVFSVADGTSYVVWSGWPGDDNGQQNLYLAELASPTRTRGPALLLSEPRLDWETSAGTVGVLVNEGPAALVRDGKVYLSYSGSGCWTPDYALGLLTADAGADLTKAASWQKSPQPVFTGGDESGEYGTGHNSFFTSPDGSQTWFAYHAVTTPAGSCGPDRQVYAQPLTFAADGTPQFGVPSGSETLIPLPAGDPGS